jgi:two-component system cell cycle sensor histidine kinase/response regulator CckA
MGLAMVHGIIERHDGYMEVELALGEGTTFSIFFLPLVQKEERVTELAWEDDVGRCNVLVADDEPLIGDFLRRSLSKDGHVVELATGGDDALDRFLRGNFDLVITDWSMPGLNGGQLSNAIQMNGNSVPVIMITGFGEMFDETDDHPNGVDYIMPNPLTQDALRKAIRTVLAETRSAKQALPTAS